MRWYERPLRIAALQCASEGDPKRVLEIWDKWGFNTEQLLHLSAYGYAGYFRPDKARELEEYVGLAKERGIRIIFYIAPGAFAKDFLAEHPDCVQRKSDGQLLGGACMNSPYRQLLFDMVREVAQYGIDGVFLDGPTVRQGGCYCPHCQEKFQGIHGKPLPREEDVHDPLWHRFMDFRYDTIAECLRDANAALKEVRPEALLYMNSQAIASGIACARDNRRLVKHQEILGAEGGFIFYTRPEEVPWWKPGETAKLIESQAEGKPTVVFLAADHKPWNRTIHTAAETKLLYADTIANGANVWYGLHSPIEDIDTPGGRAAREMNLFLKKNERYYEKTRSGARVALMRSAVTMDYYQRETEISDFSSAERKKVEGVLGNAAKSFEGFYEMLLRSHILFDVIDELTLAEERMRKYEALVLPNCACLADESLKAITDFVAHGGSLLASFDTSLYDVLMNQKGNFGLSEVFGIRFADESYDFGISSYISITEDHPIPKGLSQKLIPAPHYGLKVETTTAKMLAIFHEPMYAQYRPLSAETTPAVVVNIFGKGRAVYLAGTFGEQYRDYGTPAHIRLIANAVSWLSKPLLRVENAPQTLEVVLREQENRARQLIHLVNFSGEMKRPFEHIIPCRDVRINLQTGREICSVRALQAEVDILFQKEKDSLNFTVPLVDAYEVIVVE
jgi:hypothetical protein